MNIKVVFHFWVEWSYWLYLLVCVWGNLLPTKFSWNTNSGKQDIFLVKYNSSGAKLWTKQLGTPLYDSANGLAIDSSDNIYLTGYTQGNLYTYSGGKDVFVVKYNSSGTKQWTRQFGAPSFSQKSPYNSSSQMVSSEDEGKKVSIDSSGNIYLTGNTQGGLDGNSNSGKEDIFLIKYKSMWCHWMNTIVEI